MVLSEYVFVAADCRLNITSGSLGLIEIAAVTEGGIMHCTPATLLAVPQEIADEIGQLAQCGAHELRLQRRYSKGRMDGDVNALANQLSNLVVDVESDRNQVEEEVWRKYFHPLIQDLGIILQDPGCHSLQTEEKLYGVLVYLILNHAYKTAQFLLRMVAGRGVLILWNGIQIPARDIDLNGIDKTWSGK
ncbi:hypothetical protein BSKO_13451 [Bryopsis sp. KO-2023]|nr:hypothetical protein BSKO_13451 [Bryopsis sp. KO-2023]